MISPSSPPQIAPFAFGAGTFLQACDRSAPPAVATVKVSRLQPFLPALGDTVTLKATAFDGTGAVVSASVQWTTASSSAATVSSTGLVTAVRADVHQHHGRLRPHVRHRNRRRQLLLGLELRGRSRRRNHHGCRRCREFLDEPTAPCGCAMSM